MIFGVVSNGYATVPIIFRLPNQPNFSIEFKEDGVVTIEQFKSQS